MLIVHIWQNIKKVCCLHAQDKHYKLEAGGHKKCTKNAIYMNMWIWGIIFFKNVVLAKTNSIFLEFKHNVIVMNDDRPHYIRFHLINSLEFPPQICSFFVWFLFRLKSSLLYNFTQSSLSQENVFKRSKTRRHKNYNNLYSNWIQLQF